jgi:hypothetical protein
MEIPKTVKYSFVFSLIPHIFTYPHISIAYTQAFGFCAF